MSHPPFVYFPDIACQFLGTKVIISTNLKMLSRKVSTSWLARQNLSTPRSLISFSRLIIFMSLIKLFTIISLEYPRAQQTPMLISSFSLPKQKGFLFHGLITSQRPAIHSANAPFRRRLRPSVGRDGWGVNSHSLPVGPS